MNSTILKGSAMAALSYVLWGFLPLYWHLLLPVGSFHILAYRIIFSLVFVAAALLFQRKRAWLRHFLDPKKRFRIIAGSLLITFNWGLYIWAVNSGHTIEAALGYFINPLLSVMMGLLFFREKLKPLQWCAFGLACAGVGLVTAFSGTFPWISICLALSFGFYGMVKKTLSFDALEALAAETLAALPIAAFLLAFPFPGGQGFSDLAALPRFRVLVIPLAGPVTA
ncbi:MAG: EamA family transporter RarD, partial [Spirochaetaceae bacterium]|nr:EamA family transporter RarD [Spirochaetaceae bacterium]